MAQAYRDYSVVPHRERTSAVRVCERRSHVRGSHSMEKPHNTQLCFTWQVTCGTPNKTQFHLRPRESSLIFGVSPNCLSLSSSISDSPVRISFPLICSVSRAHIPITQILVSIARFISISYQYCNISFNNHTNTNRYIHDC